MSRFADDDVELEGMMTPYNSEKDGEEREDSKEDGEEDGEEEKSEVI